MKIEDDGVRVSTTDIAHILKNEGDYADRPGFIQQASILARHTIGLEMGELRERVAESDPRFAMIKGLPEKFEHLDEATSDELSRMLSILHPKHNSDVPHTHDEAVFSFDQATVLLGYVNKKIKQLEELRQNAIAVLAETKVGTAANRGAQGQVSFAAFEIAAYTEDLGRLRILIGRQHMNDAS